MDVNLKDFFVAVESREALERWDRRVWLQQSFLFGGVLPHPGVRKLPGQPQQKASHRVAQPEAGIDTRSRVDDAGCAYLRHQPFGEADARPGDRPPDDPPQTPGPLARRLGGARQPDDAQPRGCLGPGVEDDVETRATPCRARASSASPTGTAPSCPRPRASGAPSSRRP